MAEFCPEPKITECSICHDLYTEPKILPCAHLFCRGCLVSWIKTNKQAHCPLCRGIIDEQDCKLPTDCEAVADALPTDLAMVQLVNCTKTLARNHVCCVHVTVAASSLCLHCGDMLCQSCDDAHRKLSATRHHTVHELSTLTPEIMAAGNSASCSLHADELSKLFCSSHRSPICMLCASSSHRSCPDVITLEQMLKTAKQTLSEMEENLRRAEFTFIERIGAIEEFLDASERNTKTAFIEIDKICDHLLRSVEKCRQRLQNQVKEASDKVNAIMNENKAILHNKRSILTSHRRLIKRVRQTVPSSSVTAMLTSLKTRLSVLDLNTSEPSCIIAAPVNVFAVDRDKITSVERGLASVTIIKECPVKERLQRKEVFVDDGVFFQKVSSTKTGTVEEHPIAIKDENVDRNTFMKYKFRGQQRQKKSDARMLLKTDEEGKDSREQRTVYVYGLTAEDEMGCECYFRCKFGETDGDKITWDAASECFIITFKHVTVASKVLQRNHTMCGKNIQVEPFVKPLYYNNSILLSGVPHGTTTDHIQNYLESIADVNVDSVHFLNGWPNDQILVVMERGPVDVTLLRRLCKDNKWDGTLALTVDRVQVTGSITVRNINPKTQEEHIQNFFMNYSRSKGGPVKFVEKINATTARVNFQNCKDAKEVVEKRYHILDGNCLQASPCIEIIN